jgi:hypothetical protein
MTVVAQDPDVRRADGAILMAKVWVPAEDLIAGPTGHRVQVVDYDASSGTYHGSHKLPTTYEGESKAWREGSEAILDDHRFHAQNVYALVMSTLARFEFALGRRVSWAFDVHQLKVAPHGLMDANAFYSRQEEGLVFGYFPGKGKRTVYTCLSHDVVVHETAHALIDALRERYLDPSGPDQAAFHEGLADVIALLSVFAQAELVRELLRLPATRARPDGFLLDADVAPEALRKTALFGLAEQMGSEIQTARGEALRRSSQILPDPKWLSEPEFLEPHRRGEVFVAAIMNGFLTAWTARLMKAKTPDQKLHAVERVAEEGADIAAALLTMWIRALDYMPPVHLEFADALSAALTADLEVRPDDSRCDLRAHMLKSFRRYGIGPASRRRSPLGIWEEAPSGLRFDRVRFEAMKTDKDEVFRFLWENRTALNLRDRAYTEVLSVRPCIRVGIDGFTLRETVAEYYQVARLTADELADEGIEVPPGYLNQLLENRLRERNARAPEESPLDAADVDDGSGPRRTEAQQEDDLETGLTTPVYGGGVLIFDEYGKLKYHVSNNIFGDGQEERLDYLTRTGQLRAGERGARMTAARLSTLHRHRAIDARRAAEEGW